MTGKERREYNKKVSEWNKTVKAIRAFAQDQKRDYRRTINRLYSESNMEVPKEVLAIMENIIETQNKGVPLSDFQEEMLKKLVDLTKKIDFYEANRPKFEGDSIKDLPLRNKDGIVNYTNPGIEEEDSKVRVIGRKKGQEIATLFPDGSNIHDIIDRISETIAENARLQEMLNGKNKTAEAPSFHTRAGTKKRLSSLQELNEAIGTESKEEVSQDLETIVNAYQRALTFKMKIVKHEEGTYSLDNIPVKERSKENQDLDIDKTYVKLMEVGIEPEDIKKICGGDPKLITMLPKNITEKLIEVLARVIKENSELHNKLYKPEELMKRKWPWETIGIALAGALAVAIAASFLIGNFKGTEKNENLEPSTKIEQTIEDDNGDTIGQNEDRHLGSLIDRIDYCQDYHIDLKERQDTLSEYQDVVYQEAIDSFSSYTINDYKQIIGDDIKDLSYQEMMDRFEAETESIIRETIEFVNSLDPKTLDDISITDLENYREGNVWGDGGTFEGWHKKVSMTPEQYKKYDELYNRAQALSNMGASIDNKIDDNETYLQKLYEKTVTRIEGEIKKAESQSKGIDLGSLGIGAGGSALLIILGVLGKNALKRHSKNKEAEASNENNKEGETL